MYEYYQKLLDEKGLKNADVARATGVSNMTLSDWKRGKSEPKTKNMQKIADFLETTLSYLVTGEESNPIFEQANTDYDLSNIDSKLKDYVFKLSKLSDKEQESIMNLIDVMYEKYSKQIKLIRKVVFYYE